MQGNRGLILKAFAVLLIVMLVWSIVGKKR
jgi:hypothetical protein